MAEGARLKVCIRQRIGVRIPLTAIFKEELVRKYGLFSHFICLYGSELVIIGRQDPRQFLSCLYGSELKYYTFSPLLIKQNHLNLLLPPFFILTYPQH